MKENYYDVVICGAGIAGLTLARQLKHQLPDISIVLLDRLSRPLPEATFKVGEATTELGSYYLTEILQLEDYLEAKHLRKLGLRLFFGDSHGRFQDRPEAGVSRFLAPYAYTLDRGIVENDLRKLNIEAGMELLEDCFIKHIDLAENAGSTHQISYKQGESKELKVLRAHWVIDAMGRRRFLQKKLGLSKPNNPKYNAVWFRIDDRVDVSAFVPQTEKQWHDRVPDNNRYRATNHLCGNGYWVWIIALPSKFTSIGIVADGDIHPFNSYNTYEKAYQWMKTNEPALAEALRNLPPVDFKKMGQYSYSSKQVFSINRWACVGEAGVFSDPLYGTGMDQIGFGNMLAAQIIERDLANQLTQKTVDDANLFYLTYNDGLANNIHHTYHCFGNGVVTSMKVLWDTLAGWSFSGPMMFNSLYLDPAGRSRIRKGSGMFFLLAQRIQRLFQDWSARSMKRVSFGYLDYLKFPFFRQARLQNLKQKTEQELINDYFDSLLLLEDLAQAIFLLAVADTMPAELDRLSSTDGLNVYAISLCPERWEKDGLFKPKSSPRDLRRVMEPLREIFQVPEPVFDFGINRTLAENAINLAPEHV